MDIMSNKAITIAVALFITIVITSGIMAIISQVKSIYGQVYETNISIPSGYDEFDRYNNTRKLGIELLNTVKKYRDNPLVDVIFRGERRNTDDGITYITTLLQNGSITESTSFNTTLQRYNGTDKITINFN